MKDIILTIGYVWELLFDDKGWGEDGMGNTTN
jgi:hypothetical protein